MDNSPENGSKITFRKHIPGCAFDPREENPTYEFDNVEKLYEHSYIKQASESPDFDKFELSFYSDGYLLSKINKEGKGWVLGYITDASNILGIKRPEINYG